MSKSIIKKFIKCFFIIVMMLLFIIITSGCSDSKDINDKLIVTSLAFDLKDSEIICYVEYSDITKKGNEGGGRAKYRVVRAQGKTLPEVRYDFEMQTDKPLFLSGIRSIIFTESFANQYLVEFLYIYRSDANYRKKVHTVITRDNPEEMFTTIHEDEDSSVGFIIEGLIKSLDESGMSFSRTTMRLLENMSSEYTGILLPCIGLKEKEIALTGYSVVDDNKITGFIPVENSKALLFLKANKPKIQYIVPYNNITFTIDVKLKKRRIIASYENGEIGFFIKLDFDAKLLYGDKKTPYNFEDAISDEVAGILKKILTNDLRNAIEQVLIEYKCDYLQLDDEFRIRYPVVFEGLDWKKEFPKSAITINVNVDLSTTNTMDYGAVDVK